MKRIIVLISLVAVLACNKNSAPVPDVPLQGRWEMTDSYTGTGDGNVEAHQRIKDVYFTFTSTDSLYRLYYDFNNPTSLKNITDSTFNTDDTPLPYHYEITGNILELQHPCDEGCRWLFRKIE